MADSLCWLAGRTSIRFGATCSAAAAVPRGCERNASTSAGAPAGTTPPGVNSPTIFGKAYPSAVETALCPTPRRSAIPLSAVGPSARSTCPAAIGAASGRPSQDATSRPPDLSLSRKPPRPPGRGRDHRQDFFDKGPGVDAKSEPARQVVDQSVERRHVVLPEGLPAGRVLQNTMTGRWRLLDVLWTAPRSW